MRIVAPPQRGAAAGSLHERGLEVHEAELVGGGEPLDDRREGGRGSARPRRPPLDRPSEHLFLAGRRHHHDSQIMPGGQLRHRLHDTREARQVRVGLEIDLRAVRPRDVQAVDQQDRPIGQPHLPHGVRRPTQPIQHVDAEPDHAEEHDLEVREHGGQQTAAEGQSGPYARPIEQRGEGREGETHDPHRGEARAADQELVRDEKAKHEDDGGHQRGARVACLAPGQPPERHRVQEEARDQDHIEGAECPDHPREG